MACTTTNNYQNVISATVLEIINKHTDK